MFITKAKFTGFKKLKSQINITFSIPKETEELELLQMEKTSGFLAFNADEFKKRVEEFMKTSQSVWIKTGKARAQS